MIGGELAGEEVETSLLHFLPGLSFGLFHAVVVHFAHLGGSSMVFQVCPHRSQVQRYPSIGLVAIPGGYQIFCRVLHFSLDNRAVDCNIESAIEGHAQKQPS